MSQNCDVPRGKRRRPLAVASVLASVACLTGCAQSVAPRVPSGVSLAMMEALARHADPTLSRLSNRAINPAQVDIEAHEIGWRPLDLGHPPSLGLEAVDADAARRVNGFIPAAPTTAAAAFLLRATGPERERALLCLTQAIYYEAALEPNAGQAAVAQIVLNRVRHPAYPHTICGVVYQGVELGIGCQFTFVCDGALARRPVDALWRRARAAAERSVNGYVMASVGSATHYHADYVFPRWAPTLVKIGQIGAHIFYRFPGPIGLPGALRQSYRGDELAVGMSSPRPAVILVDTIADAAQGYFHVNPGAVRQLRRPLPGDVLFGRRIPSADEIAKINEALLAMDKKSTEPAPATSPTS